jgi:hypothetical protein
MDLRTGPEAAQARVTPLSRAPSRDGHDSAHRAHSILKLVETKWNLPALTYRDANALPPLDMLDLRRPSFAEPPPLARPLAATDPGALACSVTGPGTIPPPGSVTSPGPR